jgi:hypothetical protein
MSAYQYHGNYCGPGWTAGKYMSADDATINDFNVPAVDELDQICKTHDMAIWHARGDPKKLKQADKQFTESIKNAGIPGIKDNVAAFAVWAMGPGPKLRTNNSLPNLPPSTDMLRGSNKRPRNAFRPIEYDWDGTEEEEKGTHLSI